MQVPSCDISPIRKICGQCCSVLAKKGFVTPNITAGLKNKRFTNNKTGDKYIFKRCHCLKKKNRYDRIFYQYGQCHFSE